MKIFIDSADINEIKLAYSLGIIDGVTTNPSLIKKALGKLGVNNLKEYIESILEIAGSTPVSLEVNSLSADEMIEEGIKLYNMFSGYNVCIKIPVSTALSRDDDFSQGIIAVRELSKRGIDVNCTLIFTPEQALLAAKAGARYVSPFAGRIDDYIRFKQGIEFNKNDYFPYCGLDAGNEKECCEKRVVDDNGIVSGVDLVAKCVEIIDYYGYDCEVIAASIRNSRQARECALVGSHIATLPFKVIKEMFMHEKLFEGVKKFMDDFVDEYKRMK